jgi:hypothetical protein
MPPLDITREATGNIISKSRGKIGIFIPTKLEPPPQQQKNDPAELPKTNSGSPSLFFFILLT